MTECGPQWREWVRICERAASLRRFLSISYSNIVFLFPLSAYGNKEKWERSPRMGFVWLRGVGAKLFAFLISRLGCSAPAVAHMLPARPSPLLRILRSTVSRPPQHQINVKYRLWYLSVIIVAYLFDISSLVCSLLSLFAAVCGKIKEQRKSFEMNLIRTAEVESGNKIIQICFFILQKCVMKHVDRRIREVCGSM